MISTTGRSTVIDAPTPMPVTPCSEIRVSMTRDFPNSSTIPDNTLNGVPASATSSPMMKTLGSRRISSDSASRTASAIVNSRTATSGIHILPHLIRSRVRGLQSEGNRRVDFRFRLRLDFVELRLRRVFLAQQPLAQHLNRIALGPPLLFFLFGTVVFAAHVTDVVAVIPVGIAQKKRGPLSRARLLDHAARHCVHRADILSVHAFRRNSKRRRPRQDFPRRRFGIMRV